MSEDLDALDGQEEWQTSADEWADWLSSLSQDAEQQYRDWIERPRRDHRPTSDGRPREDER